MDWRSWWATVHGITNNWTRLSNWHSPLCLPTHGYTYIFFHVRDYGFCPHISLFSRSVLSDSLGSHGLQQARLPCPSPTPGAYSNSCPLSRWCHSIISSSVIPYSSCLQSFQHQGLFKWVSSLHLVAKVLELQLQYQSYLFVFWFKNSLVKNFFPLL